MWSLTSNDSNCRARKQFPYHNPADNMVASVRNDDSESKWSF